MIIYKTTNLLNGKIYIGKDANNTEKYLGSGKLLNRALKKHGRRNFKKEILEKCNPENINIREQFWIDKMNSQTPNGYNLTAGGSGGRTHYKSVFQYNLKGQFIKKWTSIKEASSTLNIDHRSISNNAKEKLSSAGGFIWSFLKKKTMPEYLDKRSKKVLQYGLDGQFIKEWNSLHDIERHLGFNNSNVQKVCNNVKKYNRCGGFYWQYKNKDLPKKIDVTSKLLNTNSRNVLQYDDDFKLIKKWHSLRDIIKDGTFKPSGISKACANKIKYKNFYWKYEK